MSSCREVLLLQIVVPQPVRLEFLIDRLKIQQVLSMYIYRILMSNKPLAQFFNILYLNRCFLIYPLFDFNVF